MTTDVQINPEEKEGESSETSDVKDIGLLSEFASYTTLHGLHFVAGPFMLIRRILWAILVVVGAGLLISLCIERYGKLAAKDTVTTKEHQSDKLIPFPAVTVCNLNMLRKDKIIGTEAQIFMDSLAKVHSKEKLINDSNETFTLDLDKVVREAGHNISEMLLDCTFQQKPCSSNEFFTAVFPKVKLIGYFFFFQTCCYTLWPKYLLIKE